MVTALKRFGFKDLSLLDQHKLFEMLETYRPRRVQQALQITLKKFKDRPVKPLQFINYWEAVTKKQNEKILHQQQRGY